MKNLVAILIAILLFSCSSTKNEQITVKKSYKIIASEILGSKYSEEKNSSDDKILIYTKKEDKSTSDRIMKLHILVYDKKAEKIIYDQIWDNSTVEWENEHKLKITTTPEMLKSDEKLNEELRVKYVDLRNISSNTMPRKHK